MSSTNTRERAAARARLERQMAEKLEAAHKRKQRMTIIGAAAGVLLLTGGLIWAVVSLGDDKPAPSGDLGAADAPSCIWSPDDVAQNPDLKEVGAPATGVAPDQGTQTMTITMNIGVLEVEVDTAGAPCTARSMTYLAGKNFFDNTKCHRLTTSGIKVLQCGDPSGTGRGGPTYKMAEENLPNFTDVKQNYPIGTIAMAKAQPPNTTGSQFFIVYGETPLPGDYTILGKVTKGLEHVQEAAKVGVKKTEDGKEATDGAPVNDIIIQSLTITPAQEG